MQSNLSPEEKLSQWLGGNVQRRPEEVPDAETKELVELARLVDEWQVPAMRTKDDAWARLNERINQEVATAVTPTTETPQTSPAVVRPLTQRVWVRWASIAAVGLVLVASWLVLRQPTIEVIKSANGQQLTQVELPDGSRVSLNAGSELSYNTETWTSDRAVSLTGEGFFEVERGSTFRVETSHGAVTVLGTSFNVYSRAQDLNVVCYTGKVQVAVEQPKGAEEVLTLTPGMFVEANGGEVAQGELREGEAGPGWLDGSFSYRSAPLQEVMDEISRQFDVKILLEAKQNQRYSGKFTNDTLNNALKTVCGSMGLAIFEDNGVYHIRSN